MTTAKDRLIIALDVPSIDEARTIIDRVDQSGQFYKIGYQLMPIGGFQLAEELSAKGKNVFLDSKATRHWRNG